MDARTFCVEEALRDGRPVTFRAARADDAPRYVRAFAGLEKGSIYTRFFAFKDALSEVELARLGKLDAADEAIVVATVRPGPEEAIIASGHYVASDARGGPRCAEIAFVVEEDYQRQGIARRLLGHLAAIARAHAFTHFEAFVLPTNRPMLAVFAGCGCAMTQRRVEDLIHVTLALGEGAAPGRHGP